MRILAVDDKDMPRKVLARAIAEAAPDAELTVCAFASEVLALPNVGSYDVAFVDINMPGMDGVALVRELKRRNPKLNIVFATAYGEYMADAFALHSSGYLIKPITTEAVAKELENLRFPPSLPKQDNAGRLVVRCFGDFEIFANGKPVAFGRTKSKELFAFLVDRKGAIVSLREAEAVIWDDRSNGWVASSSYLRTLVSDLRRTLTACGHGDVLIRRRGRLGVDVERMSCDLYDFLAGDPLAIAGWRGEYMNQYSWAEDTKAALAR